MRERWKGLWQLLRAKQTEPHAVAALTLTVATLVTPQVAFADWWGLSVDPCHVYHWRWLRHWLGNDQFRCWPGHCFWTIICSWALTVVFNLRCNRHHAMQFAKRSVVFFKCATGTMQCFAAGCHSQSCFWNRKKTVWRLTDFIAIEVETAFSSCHCDFLICSSATCAMQSCILKWKRGVATDFMAIEVEMASSSCQVRPDVKTVWYGGITWGTSGFRWGHDMHMKYPWLSQAEEIQVQCHDNKQNKFSIVVSAIINVFW